METKDPNQCECGIALNISDPESPLGQVILTRHLNSKTHKYRREIARLLSETDMLHADIATRLGMGLPEVGKIAREFGFESGRARRHGSTLNAKATLWQSFSETHPVIRKCRELGYTVAPVLPADPGAELVRRAFLVNGHRVVAMSLRLRERKPSGNIWSFQPVNGISSDFQIAHTGDVFYIFPSRVLAGIRATSFVEKPQKPRPIHGGKHSSHGYQQYRGAWHLLARSRKAKRAP